MDDIVQNHSYQQETGINAGFIMHILNIGQ